MENNTVLASKLREDKEQLRMRSRSLSCDEKAQIGSFFDNDNLFYLTNNKGEIYCNAYVKKASNVLFPRSGDWIKEVSGTQEGMDAKEYFNNKLLQSNFYTFVEKAIKFCVLYGEEIATVNMDSGLDFKVLDGSDMIVAVDCAEDNKRCYSESTITLVDVPMGIDPQLDDDISDPKKAANEVIVTRCIVPNREEWRIRPTSKEYKFVSISLYSTTQGEFAVQEEAGYTLFPVTAIESGGISPLGKLALIPAMEADRYDKEMNHKTDQNLNPVLAIGVDTLNTVGTVSTRSQVLPIQQGEIMPQSIDLGATIPKEKEHILRNEQTLYMIFKQDLIQQATGLGMSQYEFNAINASLVSSFAEHISEVVYKVIPAVLSRALILLEENDSVFKSQATQAVFDINPIGHTLASSTKLANLGRFGQLAVPYMQMLGTPAEKIIKVDDLLQEGLSSYGLSFAAISEEEQQMMLEQEVQAMQAREEKENEKMDAETQALVAQTSEQKTGQ